MRIRNLLLFSMLFITGLSWSQRIEHKHSVKHAFIENKGQWENPVLFQSNFSGGNLWVMQKKMIFHLQDFSGMQEAHVSRKSYNETPKLTQTVVHLNFTGANDVTNIEKLHKTDNYYNYFIGNDQTKWASEVHGYGEAIMHDLYDGIDLKLIEQQQELKYEFHVQPRIDPSQIILDYAGQNELRVDKKGNLRIKTDLGEIIEQKPYAYQIVNGNIREVTCAFNLEGSVVKFDLGTYNPNVKLIIDPVLVFATYSGSDSDNFGMTATYGYDGTAYSGGVVYGNGFPMPDPSAYDVNGNFTAVINPTYGITDVFISKYSADGTNMLWATYLGGGDANQGTETAQSLICDEQNNLYIYGATSSTDFPIQGGYQGIHSGGTTGADFLYNGVYFGTQGTDIYVAKLSANGQNLLASTFLGGTGNDGINYRTTVIYNNVAAYDSLTPNYGDQFRGEIMIDSIGNCLVASCTKSINFPTLNAFQNANAGGQDGVVFKLDANLANLQWSSYYGGSDSDACYSVKIDSSDNVIFAGGTTSNDLTNMAGGWQSVYNGGKTDGFVVKLSPSGTTITQGTYTGTVSHDQAFFVEIDRADNIYVLGQSQGGLFPVINSPFVNPGSSQFVMKFDPTLTAPIHSTVFGNGSPNINISPSAFLIDICGNIYISGWGANILQSTPLSGMPTTPDAYQGTSPNGFDFYLLVIERDFADTLYGTYMGGNQADEHVDGGTSRFDKNGVVYQSVCGGCGGFSDFPTTPGAWSAINESDNNNCNNIVFKFDFELIPVADFMIDDNFGCLPFTVEFENNSTDSDSYLWDFGNGDTTSQIFEPIVTFDTAGVYTVFLYVTDSICLLTDTAEITITVTDSLSLSTIPDQELCITTPIDFIAYTFDAATSYIWSSNINFTDTLNTNLSDSIWTHTPSGPMTYYIQASNPGCSSIDSVVVDFIGSALILTANDSICAGEQTTITATNTNPTISFNYVWTPDSVIVAPSITNSVTVYPITSQYIYVTATSNTGCVVNDSIQIYVGNIPTPSVIATAFETLVAEGSTVQLIGEPSGLSYIWSPGQGVVNVNGQITDAVVDQTTIYTLTVTDGICAKTDTVLITTFEFICGDPYLYIPNAFSPNGDGENEILYVRGALVEEMVFRIYDRWGEMVFESFDRTDGWDGTFRGKALDPDVYDYYLDVTCVGGDEAIVKGNITLLR
jgi:gliding motility-associated-like protein